MIDEAQIEELVGEIGGTVGIYYQDLSSGSTFELNADESFPAASMIKAPVLWELFRAADRGLVDLSRTMTLSVAMKMEGWGVLKSLSDGLRMSLGDLATLMIVISDNVATDMVLSHLDFASVNASMRELGLTGTELRHSMRGLSAGDAGASTDQPNVTTPADCARLFKAIHSGGVLSQSAHRAMNTIFIQQLDKAIIPRYLPPGVRCAHKTGETESVRHDAGIVLEPGRPYALAILSKDAGPIDSLAALYRIDTQLADLARCFRPDRA